MTKKSNLDQNKNWNAGLRVKNKSRMTSADHGKIKESGDYYWVPKKDYKKKGRLWDYNKHLMTRKGR